MAIAIGVDSSLYSAAMQEIKTLNELSDNEYRQAYQLADEKQRRKVKKLQKLTMKLYTEAALRYFMDNHIDPRTMGEERDLLTEVRKLRNNVFSFMQVQERTYLMPFIQDVYDLKNRTESIGKTSLDMLNLMEIFIDMMLSGLGIPQAEQDKLRQKAAQQFMERKALIKAKR